MPRLTPHSLRILLLFTAACILLPWFPGPIPARSAAAALPPIVFVARAHLATRDHIFTEELGPAGQFGTGLTKFAPGSRLVRLDPDGSLFLYDTPGLVDVQSPDVSFDAERIVFSGAKTLDPVSPDSGWRLYEINVDGSGFHQLTHADREFEIPNAGEFGNQEIYGTYDDLFPAYLADGRIVFSSSRYPSRAHYDERRSFNLYIINADGSGLHRITTERGGLLHPAPLPDGRILAARWWNQFNQPSQLGVYNRIDNADTDHLLPDGTLILANPDETFSPAHAVLPGGFQVRDAPNTWHLMTLNPDGSNFQRFAWTPRYPWKRTDDSGFFDTYAAAQPAPLLTVDGLLVAYTSQPDSTMVHSTLESGIRIAYPGLQNIAANTMDAIAGLTYEKAWEMEDTSGPYALHPWGLPDGRILYSQSLQDGSLPGSGTYEEAGITYQLQGSDLRYELYTMDLDGGNRAPLLVDLASIGLETSDAMDAKPIVARAGWTAIPDAFTELPEDDPRLGNLPNTLPEYAFSLKGLGEILTATIHNPNVYANPSLLSPFANNSPPPGSAATLQIWVDANQFTGSYCYNDWPQPCADFRQDNQLRAVLWDEVPVSQQGEFTANIPADTPSFFVLRDAEGRAIRGWNRGYISIAQGNAWARPGQTVTCTGCHMGHFSGSLDGVEADVAEGWTNVAPYASVAASSHYVNEDPDYQPFTPAHVNDRRGWVPTPAGFTGGLYQDEETGWISEAGRSAGEWVELHWPAVVEVRSIRLVGPPPSGGDWGGFGQPAEPGDYYVESGTLQLFNDGEQVGEAIPVGRVHPLTAGGTQVDLAAPIEIDRLRFTIGSISGNWWWQPVAALNEIEVVGRSAEPFPTFSAWNIYLPVLQRIE